MVACKDFRKGIIQLQWEHRKMEMQMEDLNNKSRDIRRLKLTEEQRDVSATRSYQRLTAYLDYPCSFYCLIVTILHHRRAFFGNVFHTSPIHCSPHVFGIVSKLAEGAE